MLSRQRWGGGGGGRGVDRDYGYGGGIGGGGGLGYEHQSKTITRTQYLKVFVILKREIDPAIEDARIKATLEAKEVIRKREEDEKEKQRNPFEKEVE